MHALISVDGVTSKIVRHRERSEKARSNSIILGSYFNSLSSVNPQPTILYKMLGGDKASNRRNEDCWKHWNSSVIVSTRSLRPTK
jgi:hypothetical protein